MTDYRELLSRTFAEGRRIALGDPGEVAAQDRSRVALLELKDRPLKFVRDYLGETTWEASRRTMRALVSHGKVHVSGCRKSSKSHTAAQVVLWGTCTAPTRCIVTGSTYTQVRENIFARVRKLHAGAKQPLPGRLGVTSLRMPDPDWMAIGISTNRPGNLQGFHSDIDLPPELDLDDEWIDEDSLLAPDPRLADEDARRSERDAADVIGEEIHRANKLAGKARLLFILDEMAEMRPDIVETLAGSWMGENVRVLSQFNPTFPPDSAHPAARFLRPNSGWHRIHIAGREPPAEMHPDGMFDSCVHGVPVSMMPDAWVEERLADWTPGSALTACHLYGLPANVGRDFQFIPYRLIKARFDKPIPDNGRVSWRHIGWDIAASEAGDWNVAQLWVNGQLTAEEQWRSGDTAYSTSKVLRLAETWGSNGVPVPTRNIHIDATGGSVGKAIADGLLARGIVIDPVDFGAGEVREWEGLYGAETFFANRKAELLWVLAKVLERGMATIPQSFADTIRQAQWYTWKNVPRASGTAIGVVESKDVIRKLFGRSPDNLEAATLAWSRATVLPTFGTTNDYRRT